MFEPHWPLMDHIPEVIELSQEEWDLVVAKHLKRLGLTEAQLREKHKNNTLTNQERKVWMLLQ